MERITLAGLVRIEFPTATVRLCDGGYVDYAGERYLAIDPVFGSLAGFEITGSDSDSAPGGKLTFLTNDEQAAAQMVSPGFQKSKLRIWLAEVDEATGEAIGTPQLLVMAQLDRGIIRENTQSRRVELEFVGLGERLMTLNEGNSLNSVWHKSNFPGELGFDNAIGQTSIVAWGAAAPPRGVSGGGLFSGGGGGMRSLAEFAQAQ